MNITNRNAVDLSSFFLFEVTGDSEFCSKFDSEDTSVSLDEDDAESCSWGISADDDLLYASIGYEHDSIGEEEFVIDYLEEDEDDDEDETTSDPAYRKWSSGEINNIGKSKESHNNHNSKQKSCVSVDSTTKEFESLNEMEKNKLFWETCLAS
ncbi:hypothetical protein F8388_007123 [Cannabis sativa]|nr:hypothetical protein G4B88_030096 [Cannabis sativa]KAF4357587.1 hypothetical protein F8388_007123 [Cannabis sativa]